MADEGAARHIAVAGSTDRQNPWRPWAGPGATSTTHPARSSWYAGADSDIRGRQVTTTEHVTLTETDARTLDTCPWRPGQVTKVPCCGAGRPCSPGPRGP